MGLEDLQDGQPEEIDLPDAILQSEKEFIARLDGKKQNVENDSEVQAFASEIDRLCSELITLGKRTEGDLIDNNGPFSQLDGKIKNAVEAYERKIKEKFGEYPTPLTSRMYPKYIADNFLSKARFPYLTVGTSYEIDALTNWMYNFMTIELDDIAIIDAIDAE